VPSHRPGQWKWCPRCKGQGSVPVRWYYDNADLLIGLAFFIAVAAFMVYVNWSN
jgi:hypothetical protein